MAKVHRLLADSSRTPIASNRLCELRTSNRLCELWTPSPAEAHRFSELDLAPLPCRLVSDTAPAPWRGPARASQGMRPFLPFVFTGGRSPGRRGLRRSNTGGGVNGAWRLVDDQAGVARRTKSAKISSEHHPQPKRKYTHHLRSARRGNNCSAERVPASGGAAPP